MREPVTIVLNGYIKQSADIAGLSQFCYIMARIGPFSIKDPGLPGCSQCDIINQLFFIFLHK